jgi:hypothetical protein
MGGGGEIGFNQLTYLLRKKTTNLISCRVLFTFRIDFQINGPSQISILQTFHISISGISQTDFNTKHKTQNTKHKTQNTKHKTQNTKHKTQNSHLWGLKIKQRISLQNEPAFLPSFDSPTTFCEVALFVPTSQRLDRNL